MPWCLLALVREAGLDQLVPRNEPTETGRLSPLSEVIATACSGGQALSASAVREGSRQGDMGTRPVAYAHDERDALRCRDCRGATENVVQVFVTAIRRWEHGAPSGVLPAVPTNSVRFPRRAAEAGHERSVRDAMRGVWWEEIPKGRDEEPQTDIDTVPPEPPRGARFRTHGARLFAKHHR